jgi:Gluconate 2-dehydrogenase subunit 3
VTPRILTSSERALLRFVLNRLVPAAGPFPAAGDLGVVEYFDRAAGSSPSERRVLLEGLRQIEMLGERRPRGGFAALAGQEQDAVLRDVERRHPELFEAILQHTYNAYYSHPTVIRLLGIDGPPQPRGYPLPPFDNDLTENVRRRGPIYRRP